MAITKKPLVHLTDQIINKGGSSPTHSKNQNIKVTIRMPLKMLNIIDDYLERSIHNKTRTCWIREAVEEKIARDNL